MTSVTGQWTDSGGTVWRDLGGVLRNTNGSWEILNDATHKSLNLTSVTATNAAVLLSIPSGTWIGPFLVTPDETYSAMGIFCGASVTQTLATISIYRLVGSTVRLVNPKTLVTTWGNLWISGRQIV